MALKAVKAPLKKGRRLDPAAPVRWFEGIDKAPSLHAGPAVAAQREMKIAPEQTATKPMIRVAKAEGADSEPLTEAAESMHDICMATKTITLELDAYEKLRRAKRDDRESFSSVVRRAHWEDQRPNALKLLEELQALTRRRPEVLLPAKSLDALARRKRTGRRSSVWDG